MKSSTRFQPYESFEPLARLGVHEEELRSAIAMGDQARRSCTHHDTATLPGFLMFAKTTAHLRQRLVPRGWSPSREGGLEGVLSPDRRTAIIVVTGDMLTGNLEVDPRSKNPRGSSTADVILANNQLTFDWMATVPASAGIETATWALLVNVGEDEVTAELSLPAGRDESGRINRWKERIMLTPVPRGGSESKPQNRDEDEGPDIDIDVSRRNE